MKIRKQAEQYPLQSPSYDDYDKPLNDFEHQEGSEEEYTPPIRLVNPDWQRPSTYDPVKWRETHGDTKPTKELRDLMELGWEEPAALGYLEQQSLKQKKQRERERRRQRRQQAAIDTEQLIHDMWREEYDKTEREKLEEGNALEPGQRMWNRDPARGTTVPHVVGGDPGEVVSIEPPDTAGPTDAFEMPDSESGLGYNSIVRRNDHGGYDVLRPI